MRKRYSSYLRIIWFVWYAVISLESRVMPFFPDIGLFKWSNESARRIISTYYLRSFNHNYVGCIDEIEKLNKSYSKNKICVLVGNGIADFNKATNIVMNFGMVNCLDWIKVLRNDQVLCAGSDIATMSRFKCLWTLNPCRVVNVVQNRCVDKWNARNHHLYSEIAFSTLNGHLIEGEERFRVIFNRGSNKDVIFEASSFSKGSGILGSIAFPFVRRLQALFFQDISNSMQELMKS